MRTRSIIAVALALAALFIPAQVGAAGARRTYVGGTPTERAQVEDALAVSSFDWNRLPSTIVVHIDRGAISHSDRGEVWLDADLLDAGSFSWATVQDEFSHQIDFFLLTPTMRVALQQALHAKAWCYENSNYPAHSQQGCERFSSMVPWAYWPSKDDAYRPTSRTDESAAMAPAKFRALLNRLLASA
jgi:hypothetical protein